MLLLNKTEERYRKKKGGLILWVFWCVISFIFTVTFASKMYWYVINMVIKDCFYQFYYSVEYTESELYCNITAELYYLFNKVITLLRKLINTPLNWAYCIY